MMAVTCPRCRQLAKPGKLDEFSYCPCSSVYIVQREDGHVAAGGPNGWRLVEVDE